MDQVVRPGSIEITTQFVDRDGEPANPAHAYLRIAYSAAGAKQIEHVEMIRDGDDLPLGPRCRLTLRMMSPSE